MELHCQGGSVLNKEAGFPHRSIALWGLGFTCLYILGIVFSGSWWAFHWLEFLSPGLKFGIPLISIGLNLVLYFIPEIYEHILEKWSGQINLNSWILIVTIALVSGVCYYHFPMYESLYGDAELFQERMGDATTENNPIFLQQLLSPDVSSPKNGNRTVLSAVRLLSFHFQVSHRQVYLWLDAISGMIYVLLWLSFLNVYLKDTWSKIAFGLLGVMAPFAQFFFGYMEIYAPSVPIVTGYFLMILAWYKWKRLWMLIALPVLLFLSLKVHSASYIMIPSCGLVILAHLFRARSEKWLDWKRMSLFVLVPIIAAGAVVYFVVLKDHVDERFVGPEVDIYTRLFLPIFSPPEPLDRYTLLSVNHFFDYFNMIFLWSGGMLMVLGVVAFHFRKKINWNASEVLIIGVTMVLYTLLFFMINPLMSMPYDWDYFSQPGPVLCVFVLGLFAHLDTQKLGKALILPAVGISLLTVPIFIVNAKPEALSYRLESLGKYVFKTYWIRSAGDIRAGVNVMPDDFELRYQSTIRELRPYALPGKDQEFATIVWELARYYRKSQKDYVMALEYHQLAREYDPSLAVNYIGLMEASFFMQKYEVAYSYSQDLLRFNYPSRKEALGIAIHCAVMAGFRNEALGHSEEYIAQWPEENMINVRDHLRSEVSMDVVRNLFGG